MFFSFGVLLLEIVSGKKPEGSLIHITTTTFWDMHGCCGNKTRPWNQWMHVWKIHVLHRRYYDAYK
ncbi:unnamed protein product, partial [Vitis vinifera]|uniref:Serine-threonine/tyrosine-protein kinase catalytic domain-containing protein n=1 Tax=Vitis vinifera TaxID=29760 RepID=D7UAZ6_VITVI